MMEIIIWSGIIMGESIIYQILGGKPAPKEENDDYKKEIDNVDIWGFRSLPLKRDFETKSGVIPKKWFMCYSGIPNHFLNTNYTCDVSKPIRRFVDVGSFIRRKFPEKL